MRQRPNFRRNARDLPHRWQRLCCRTANFGFRLLFSIIAFRAILFSLANQWFCLQPNEALVPGAGLWREISLPRSGNRHLAPNHVLGTHNHWLDITAERHSKLAQQSERVIIAIRGGYESHIHSVHLLHLIVVDLREDHLLLETE